MNCDKEMFSHTAYIHKASLQCEFFHVIATDCDVCKLCHTAYIYKASLQCDAFHVGEGDRQR